LRSAIDSATGEEVLPERSARRRPYNCPNCGKRVILRYGESRKYFAHATGVGDEECELYVSARIPYTGRRYIRVPSPESGAFLRSDHLAFGIGLLEPQLALFLPPTDDEEWTGSLRFTADRLSRTYRFQHLAQGQRCRFPLMDGKWMVVPENEVSEAYLDRIEIGPQMLAEGQNLFDASRDFGKQILPGEPVFAGDALWWLSRSSVSMPPNLLDFVTLTQETIVKEWFIYRVTVSQTLVAGKDRDALASWLQRPVRPRRARVWIEEPWAWGHSALGVPIFDITDGAISIRSEQQADIAVRSVDTGELAVSADMATELGWIDVREGDWELLANGAVQEIFRVSGSLRPVTSNVVAEVDGGSAVDFVHLQAALNDVAKNRKTVCQIDLSWGEESVGDLVELNGKRLLPGNLCATSISLQPGSTLSIDKIGAVSWPPLVENVALFSNLRPLRQRAAWLLSVAEKANPRAQERIRVPRQWQQDPLLRQLMGLAWPDRLAAQVRTLQRLLELSQ
jgi:predicted RNA-binding Zn-ribbon protein involved in translation (DUF1610 family)